MKTYSYSKKGLFSKKRIKNFFGAFFIGGGLVALIYFFFPLLSYHIYLSSVFANSEIETPIPNRMIVASSPSVEGLIGNGIASLATNYKDARSWFPHVEKPKVVSATEDDGSVDEYYLSIPSQKIENAKVSATDFDLSKNLVQYFSTSKNPIEKGTSVIFGHSTLPQLFNSKDYNAIFAKMHTMENGEDIILTVNNKNYTYKVFSRTITDPEDPNIFSQSFDNSYITIITCTPPGTTWKRLVIRASLQKV